jgi:hypothetical protein
MHKVLRCRSEFQRDFPSQKMDGFCVFHVFGKSLVFNEEVA